jgi:ribosomal protein S25
MASTVMNVEGKPMTMRDFLNEVKSAEVNERITAYCDEQLTKLDERNASRKGKLTTKQQTALELGEKIYNEMESERTYTASELVGIYGTNTQTITPIMKKLAEQGKITIVDGYKPAKGKSKCKGYVKA